MKDSFIVCVFKTIIISTIIASSRYVTASIIDNNHHAIQKDSICETPACIHASSFILGNMNSSIDPCENFYQFACGKFIQETSIPDNKVGVSLFSMTNDKILQQLRLKISDEIKEDDHLAINKMKSYYHTCMDTDQIEKTSENDLREVLNNLGGCPILDGQSWNEKYFDWKRSVYQANEMGYETDYFVYMQVYYDPDNSTRHIIELDQPATDLPTNIPRESLIDGKNNDMVNVHMKLMVDIFELLGADKKQAEKEINDVIDFEIKLAKISVPNEERRDQSKLNNRMTLHQLDASFNDILWSEYINEILAPHAHLHRSEDVIVVVPSFLKRLSGLIANTPNRVLANYICFRTISQTIDSMGKSFSDINAAAEKALYGVQEQQPRWKKCLGLVTAYFSTALSRLYVKHYFDKNIKTDAVYLAQNLRYSLNRLIKQANWMDNTTKFAALQKLQSLTAYVGYPQELDNDENIDELYEKLTLHPGRFLKSQMNLNQHMKRMKYSQLRTSTAETQWIEHSGVTEANAYYDASTNSFDLPAAVLQGHIYNIYRPNYMNYGAVGQIIGHELSHGFDDEGSQYDENGNFVNWWTNKTRKEYLNKVKCIIDQYGNYTVKEINVMMNGINSQGENIADNVGLKAAYYAYDKWTKTNGKESRLPGLHYTPQQMFWISYANLLCTKKRPEVLKLNLLNDPHSSEETRVVGTVSNSYEFSKDFKCPLGSPMNPAKKCTIW